jgi:hypothetical protein
MRARSGDQKDRNDNHDEISISKGKRETGSMWDVIRDCHYEGSMGRKSSSPKENDKALD